MDEVAGEIYAELNKQRAVVMSELVPETIKEIAWHNIDFMLDRLLEIRLVAE